MRFLAIKYLFDISGWLVHYDGMNAGDHTYASPEPGHSGSVRVHRHRHSHRRKRFHYRSEALGRGDWGWRLDDVGFRQLLAQKGLVRWAVVVLFAGLPLAGLQLAIWLLGSDRVFNLLLEEAPEAMTQFVR
ncbi:MAG: hypothetical protein GX456_04190 [Verrucomicrobia bacterium]|nr:hypothetical protein [Verrucomicrobiota bacterium]